jgi:hypothetical protein
MGVVTDSAAATTTNDTTAPPSKKRKKRKKQSSMAVAVELQPPKKVTITNCPLRSPHSSPMAGHEGSPAQRTTVVGFSFLPPPSVICRFCRGVLVWERTQKFDGFFRIERENSGYSVWRKWRLASVHGLPRRLSRGLKQGPWGAYIWHLFREGA